MGDVRLSCAPTDAGRRLTMANYLFGNYFLDVDERRLLRDNEEIRLRGKLFDTLRVLVENAGKLVRKDAFMESVWPDSVVEDNNLDYCISQLRKLFHPVKYIETVPRHGYRFVAPVRNVVRSAASQAVAAGGQSITPLPRQDIRFSVTEDGVRLAWASIGDGPPLVKASNWLTHLDFEWGSPIWQHWWTELSKHHRLIRYDERGNGMSQRDVPDVSFDTWVRDLETVVDAAGLDRFSLLGISRGGPIAIAYAVKHPERVSKLVLYGSFPVGLYHYGSPEELEARRALVSLTRLGWDFTIQPSAECSPNASCPTPRPSTRTGSTIYNGCQPRPKMPRDLSKSTPASTSAGCCDRYKSRRWSCIAIATTWSHPSTAASWPPKSPTPATLLCPAPTTCFLPRNRPGRFYCRSSPRSWAGTRNPRHQ